MDEVPSWGLGIPQGTGRVMVAVQHPVCVEEGTKCKLVQN